MFWSWSCFYSVLGKKGTELGMIIDRSTVNKYFDRIILSVKRLTFLSNFYSYVFKLFLKHLMHVFKTKSMRISQSHREKKTKQICCI